MNFEEKILEEIKIKEKLFKSLKYIHFKEKIKITNYNHIFIPFHFQDHWLLFLVYNFGNFYNEILNLENLEKNLFYQKTKNFENLEKTKNFENLEKNFFENLEIENKIKIISLDSLNIPNTKIMDGISEILNIIIIGKLEKKYKKKISLKKKILNSKNFSKMILKVPNQKNNFDCGLAVLENIERIINSGENFFFLKNNNFEIFYDSEIFKEKRKWFINFIIDMERGVDLEILLDDYFNNKKNFEVNRKI